MFTERLLTYTIETTEQSTSRILSEIRNTYKQKQLILNVKCKEYLVSEREREREEGVCIFTLWSPVRQSISTSEQATPKLK